jgi:hypothetical protein
MIDTIMIPISDVDEICSDRADYDSKHEGWYCRKGINLTAPQQNSGV